MYLPQINDIFFLYTICDGESKNTIHKIVVLILFKLHFFEYDKKIANFSFLSSSVIFEFNFLKMYLPQINDIFFLYTICDVESKHTIHNIVVFILFKLHFFEYDKKNCKFLIFKYFRPFLSSIFSEGICRR